MVWNEAMCAQWSRREGGGGGVQDQGVSKAGAWCVKSRQHQGSVRAADCPFIYAYHEGKYFYFYFSSAMLLQTGSILPDYIADEITTINIFVDFLFIIHPKIRRKNILVQPVR